MQSHITVMLHEAVDMLNIAPEGVYVDVTLGAGGHTNEIRRKLGTQGKLLSMDADPSAIEDYVATFGKASNQELVVANFKNFASTLTTHNFHIVDGILADLGWRTDQFTDGGKGFSFLSDDPLYMTYGDPQDYAFTAADVVNEWAEEDIANVIFAYGEERASRKIAKAIVESRKTAPFSTAKQLAEVVAGVVRKNPRIKIHPATRTFQALRIVVNDELGVLEQFIDQAFNQLNVGGRLAIITFHSLEDRIVKHRFRSFKEAGSGVLVSKKPMLPTQEEIRENPRSRSAKLRVIERHDTSQRKSNKYSTTTDVGDWPL